MLTSFSVSPIAVPARLLAVQRMFDPKNPLQAAAIFVTGLIVITYTTLDIQRTLHLNSTPASPAQTEQLREQIAESQCAPQLPLRSFVCCVNICNLECRYMQT